MLFKVMPKEEFKALIENIMDAMEVVGPKEVAKTPDGKPLHQYLPVRRFEEIDFGYETTTCSAKTYFLPYEETLAQYKFEADDWKEDINYRLMPRAIVGLHSCDIHALLKLDKVFARDFFPSPYYLSRRRNTMIIGIDHDACQGGFCRSVGTDSVTHGFDLFLTPINGGYFVAIGTDRGFSAIQQVKTTEVTEADTKAYIAERKRIADTFKTKVSVHNLPNLLDLEFESEVWKKWGDKCLSCGSCAMVCPTCYCFGVTERVSMDFEGGRKIKNLYSCNLLDFAEVAGGHNFRPGRHTRLKYRFYHHHRGFASSFEEPMCVGCNRCGRACLAGINPVDVISDLQAEEAI